MIVITYKQNNISNSTSNNTSNITKEVYSDSLNEYQKSVDRIAKYKSNYRYVSDQSIRETTSYMDTNISPESLQIKEETGEVLKEQYYERKNNSILLMVNRVRKKRFMFDEAELKVRYIQLHDQTSDQLDQTQHQKQQYRYLKLVKPKFTGCYIQSCLLPIQKKKRSDQSKQRKQSAEQIILRGQTFLLKENSAEEPLDCMIAKKDKNPYSQTRLFTTVYIPVKEFKSLEDMEEDIKRTRGRLNQSEMKQLLSDLQG